MASMLRLAGFLAPYRLRVAAALVALLVAAGTVLALGQGLKHVVDNGFGGGEPRLLDQALGAMVALAAVLAVATYFRFRLMMTTGERVVTDLRRAVFDRLLGLSPAFFESTRTGEVISRLTSDTTVLQQVIGYGLSMFVRNILMMLGAAGMLIFTSWKLAAMVLLGVPATLVPILLLGRRVRRLSRASQDRWPTCLRTSTRQCTKCARCRPTCTRSRTARTLRGMPRPPTPPRRSASARRPSSSLR